MSRSTRSPTLKWREGDGPFIHFHAQTTDKLRCSPSNGRVYTLAGDKLPGARGFGEPVRLFIDLDAEVEIVAAAGRPAGDEAAGRVVRRARASSRSGEATLAETRKGKQLVNLRPGAKVAVVRPIAGRRGRGRGDRREPQDAGVPARRAARAGARAGRELQRYRDGGLADAIAFRSRTGLAGRWAAKAGACGPKRDLTPWRAARGAAGRMPPIGFPRTNRFESLAG